MTFLSYHDGDCPNSRVRNGGKVTEGRFGRNGGEGGDCVFTLNERRGMMMEYADYGRMVQPSQQRVASCVKVVQ